MPYFVAAGVSFFLSVLVTYLLSRSLISFLQDEPNHRSLHETPTPRSGGIAIVFAIVISSLIVFGFFPLLFPFSTPLLLACGVIALIALCDDLFSLGPLVRLVAQFVAAVLIVFGAELYWAPQVPGWVGLAWAFQFVSVLLIVWSINLYNFMDGIDGLAGGMAVIGFGALGLLGYIGDDTSFTLICLLIVGSSAGFLVFNYCPASIFMGDVGSTTVGLLMAVLGLVGWDRGLYPVWVPLVIFAPFWVDATVTLLKRALKGRRIWEAHREHYYQRLVLKGLSHRHVAILEYLLMTAGITLVLFSALNSWEQAQLVPIISVFIYIVLLLCLELNLKQSRI